VLVLVAASAGWYAAKDAAARTQLVRRLHTFFDAWITGGATLVGSFDDDLFVVGQPSSLGWSMAVLFDVPDLNLVVARLHSLREEVDAVRLDSAFRVEARVGRNLFFLER
jgi:hypothetical protein